MIAPPDKIYGSTGEIGRDGILTPELQHTLERKQHEAARTVLGIIEQRQEGQLFPMAAMATGIGKTKVEDEVIRHWKRKNPNAKVLFIAGTKVSLVRQIHTVLKDYQQQSVADTDGENYDFVKSEDSESDSPDTQDIEESLKTEKEGLPFYKVGRFRDKDADVRIATIQTVQSAYNRGQFDPEEFDLVIIDEVHNTGTPIRKEIITKCKNVVGFTATPYRHSGDLIQPEEYGFKIAYDFPLKEAQDLGLLPPLLGMQFDTAEELLDIVRIPVNRKGLINYKALERVLKKTPELRGFIADKVASVIKNGEKEYKTVIAVNFVWEAQELAQLLKDRGIKVGLAVNQQAAQQIHSDEISALDSLDRYKLPKEDPNAIQVLISPYVAAEGFDAPFTEVLVWASPTDSDLRYTQYVGRMARRAEGKAFGLILDFLYQTSQYGWSYNMGMWTKDQVRQLPNGLLYLGPEEKIEGLTELEVVKTMRGKTGIIMDIKDVQKGSLEDVQDGDIVLSQHGLTEVFLGRGDNLSQVSAEVQDYLSREHPDWFATKIKGGQKVRVVTKEGSEFYIKAMVEKGVRLQESDIQDVQAGDIVLSQDGLTEAFVGDYDKLVRASAEVQDHLSREHPDWFIIKLNGTNRVRVVTKEGSEFYIKEMVEKGVQLQEPDIQDVQARELILSQSGMYGVFRGHHSKLLQYAAEVQDNLSREHPDWFAIRLNGVRRVTVVIEEGKEAFIKAMIERGVKLKEPNRILKK